jgi:predicted RNase H-like HicB family nuclease
VRDRHAELVLQCIEGYVLGYRVLYEQLSANWSGYSPDVPTILITGETREDVEQLMAEAIPLHLAVLREDRAERPWLYRIEDLSPELRAVFARIDATA